MPGTFHTRAQSRRARAGLFVSAMLVSGILLTACGGSSLSSTATSVADQSHVTRSQSSPATDDHATSSGSTSPGASGSGPLAFAKCMRASGVPNFPDPGPGGGFSIPASDDPAAPAFKTAEATCQKLTQAGAVGGALSLGATTHPTAQTLTQMRNVAECMRRHGITEFPDPTTSIPSDMAGVRQIADRDGAIFVFKDTLDIQSPAFSQAAAACELGLQHH
jgi:hypothetical protein